MTSVDVGRGWSAWWLRGAAGVAAAGMLLDLGLSGVSTVMFVIAALLALASVLLPASPAPLVLICCAALSVALTGDDPLRPAVLVLIPLVHALHLTCALAGLLPRGARFDPAALRPTLRRAAGVQAVALGLAGVAVVLPATRTPEPVELIALLSIAGLALLVITARRGGR
ncbi:hypothetical protein [Actinokineospora cianjurensis]|uniref:PI-PLC Y-box domain-containing protein n=1 Tax=Actinokineospora cianjurensis TaxID=585224 RepID=A0A421AXI3_9PSEU|nr:hypothetical protein [Actinokineospora cianjurensis]RLK54499.1 hypothetical protein CLV68_5531 [Actinokineospora cianjurensis]